MRGPFGLVWNNLDGLLICSPYQPGSVYASLSSIFRDKQNSSQNGLKLFGDKKLPLIDGTTSLGLQ